MEVNGQYSLALLSTGEIVRMKTFERGLWIIKTGILILENILHSVSPYCNFTIVISVLL